MGAQFQFPFLMGVPFLPAKRVIAIDPGTHHLKILLVELFLNRRRILRRESIDLREPRLLSPEELQGQLRTALDSIGEYPVALTLPQHATLSQIIDLPTATEDGVKSLIQAESVKLRGLSETRIVSDHVRLRPLGKRQNPYWVTLCQENEIVAQIKRLGLLREELCEVTSSANALLAAYAAAYPETDLTVLVNVGVNSTAVAILVQGQGVQASSFAIGTDLFVETLANLKRCSLDEAETWRRTRNLFDGPEALPGYRTIVDGWYEELERMIREWREDHPDLAIPLEAFQVVLSGGGAIQPGLLNYLNRGPHRLHFTLWSAAPCDDPDVPPGHFAVAYGAALQALGVNAQSASLLPSDLRAAWRGNRAAQRFQSVNFLLLLILALFLAFGTWQKLRLVAHKDEEIVRAHGALNMASAAEAVAQKVLSEYDRLRPVWERRQQTVTALQSLSLLQQVRTNPAVWYVLFADNQSYFSAPALVQTNLAALTNLTVAVTNPLPARPGFVVELCIPEEGETMRRTLSLIVANLKKSPLFRNVDSLPMDLRRNLVDPRTVILDRHFALSMELVESEFQRSSRARKALSVPPTRPPPGIPEGVVEPAAPTVKP